MERLAALLEECIRDGYTADEFLARAKPALGLKRPETEQALQELYRKILELEKLGRYNGSLTFDYNLYIFDYELYTL